MATIGEASYSVIKEFGMKITQACKRIKFITDNVNVMKAAFKTYPNQRLGGKCHVSNTCAKDGTLYAEKTHSDYKVVRVNGGKIARKTKTTDLKEELGGKIATQVGVRWYSYQEQLKDLNNKQPELLISKVEDVSKLTKEMDFRIVTVLEKDLGVIRFEMTRLEYLKPNFANDS